MAKTTFKHSKNLLRLTGRTNAKYALIKEGDRVLLGLSGGKDSMALAHVLAHMKRVTPFDFEWQAVLVGYGLELDDLDMIQKYCNKHTIPLKIIHNRIESLMDKVRPNSSICSFCARMRRGALYSHALERGFNKLALGHHLDDAVESFFMNFMHNGTLRSMPPIYRADNGIDVIRPFVHVRERVLCDLRDVNSIPTITDEACPAKKHQKPPHVRAYTKELLRDMEEKNPDLFISLKKAFTNIQECSFGDERFLD